MFRLLIASTFAIIALSSGDFVTKDGKIVGGHPVDITEAPYQVSLRSDEFGHFCGGSIIGEKHILTAAHCLLGSKPKELTVVVNTSSRIEGGDTYNVVKIIVHEKYGKLDYDIGLLVLEKPIDFSDGAMPIKLAAKGHDIADGTKLSVSGWGRTSTTGPLSDVLLQVDVPKVNSKKCKEVYEILTGNMLCAGEGGKDSCSGDSGGPLVQGDTLVGVVSFGRKCAEPGYPGVYVSVAALRDWVDSHMN